MIVQTQGHWPKGISEWPTQVASSKPSPAVASLLPALYQFTTVPEILDPVFAKTSQNARFLLSENERFGLVFVKTGSIISGTG